MRRDVLPIVLIGSIALCFSCASVPPGKAAVVTWPNAGLDPKPLAGGDTFVGPFAQVETFDLREQEESANFIALLSDGAQVQTGSSIITYRFEPDALPAIARELGDDPYRSVIGPLVNAAVRRVLGGITFAELDTSHLRAAQDQIMQLAAGELRPLHVVLERVELRQVAPISPALNRAILGTGVLEQDALRAPAELQLAQSRADTSRTEAVGVADAHAKIAPTLTPATLEELRNRAWQQLLTAPTTRVVTGDSNPRSKS